MILSDKVKSALKTKQVKVGRINEEEYRKLKEAGFEVELTQGTPIPARRNTETYIKEVKKEIKEASDKLRAAELAAWVPPVKYEPMAEEKLDVCLRDHTKLDNDGPEAVFERTHDETMEKVK